LFGAGQSVSFVHEPQPVPTQVPGQVCVCTAGQAAPLPVQFAGSVAVLAEQEAARHTVLGGWKPSAGQFGLEPVHASWTSHTSAAARHAVPAVVKTSVGHAVDVPVQLSGTSQFPADARHVMPAFPAGCWQLTLEPLH
jgi:hypothetical protein